MLGESWDTVLELVHRQSFRVAFNPSNYQAELGHAALSGLLERVSLLILNREEACMLLGRDPKEKSDTIGLIRALHALPPELVVITDAAHGAYVFDGTTLYHGEAMHDLHIEETTGAGDAFAATFTAATIRGCALAQALDFAMTNAESVLQHKGAKEVLLHWDALRQKTQAQQRTIRKLAD
jgi:sugar/nucleoside kinase (ribokinase family)